jgi:hypothetical protein
MGVLAVDFRERARNWWDFLVSNRASFEGRRGKWEGQGAGVVRLMWMGVEMWERGVVERLDGMGEFRVSRRLGTLWWLPSDVGQTAKEVTSTSTKIHQAP